MAVAAAQILRVWAVTAARLLAPIGTSSTAANARKAIAQLRSVGGKKNETRVFQNV